MIDVIFFLAVIALTIFFTLIARQYRDKIKKSQTNKKYPQKAASNSIYGSPKPISAENNNPTYSLSCQTGSNNQVNQILPNGYRRDEYHSYGISDFEIEFWELDQPGAPAPGISGWVIMDMLDGDLDGNIDF